MDNNISKTHLVVTACEIARTGRPRIKSLDGWTEHDFRNIGVGRTMDAALVGPGDPMGALNPTALEAWMPGHIEALLAPLDADEITGIATVGSWHSDKIGVLTASTVGRAAEYSDRANIPLANVNTGYEQRTVVRFEQGFDIGELEKRRNDAAAVIDLMNMKRRAAIYSLNLSREEVAWRGYAGTTIYGILNDPNLAPDVANVDAWIGGTFDEIEAEFGLMLDALETQMGRTLPDSTEFLLLLPTGYRSVLNVRQAITGKRLIDALRENYPNLRVKYSANLLLAGSTGQDLGILIAENVGDYDESTIAGNTIMQLVPSKYETIGSSQGVKVYTEDASNATAGVIVARPWAVTSRELA